MSERIPLSSLLAGPGAQSRLLSVIQRIADGEVFVYPTETIYGIGGRADSEAVRKKIINIKHRQQQRPLILLAGHKKNFEDFNILFTPIAETLARHFWPGNLTLVLPVKGSTATVGVRVSDHPLIRALYTVLTIPIFSTSANISGQAYVNDPEMILTKLGSKVDFVIDAGALPPSPPSTVVKILHDHTVEIVREGKIPKDEILSVIVTDLNVKS